MENFKPISTDQFVPHILVDCVIFGYEKGELKVLVSKLKFAGDFYSLPSGFVGLSEDVDSAAKRIIQHRTGIINNYIEPFNFYGAKDRNSKEFYDKLIELNFDPEFVQNEEVYKNEYLFITQRSISLCYYSLVDIKKVKLSLSEYDENIQWYPVHQVPELILDYNKIVTDALEALQSDIDLKLNAFRLLPSKFTMKEIHEIYETIHEKKYTISNFQKKILDLNVLERLEKKFTGAKNKAPYLYRVKKEVA